MIRIIEAITQYSFELRKYFTQKLRKITQINLRNKTHILKFYAIQLRRNYAEITQNKLRNHSAFYARFTQINYAELRNKITQFITHFTQLLRN